MPGSRAVRGRERSSYVAAAVGKSAGVCDKDERMCSQGEGRSPLCSPRVSHSVCGSHCLGLAQLRSDLMNTRLAGFLAGLVPTQP